MTIFPLPHSTCEVLVLVVWVGEEVVPEVALEVVLEAVGLWVVEGLAVDVVVPPPLIQPLATTLRARTATNNRPNNAFFITDHPFIWVV